ncbi:MAG: helix-turn-helix domain-containing protein [Chloroflexota bacterium]
MANRIRKAEEGLAAGRRLQSELGREVRDARIARGLRQTDVARSLGISHASVGRLERGELRNVGLAALSRLGATVGLRLHARFYPAGGGLRDAAQLALLRRLRSRISNLWNWQLEAPLNIQGDLRAFDAVLRNSTATVAIEAITRLRDAQGQLRAATIKQREGGIERLVILLTASHANRRALATAQDVLTTAYPLGTKATLSALAAGQDPGANGIVLL